MKKPKLDLDREVFEELEIITQKLNEFNDFLNNQIDDGDLKKALESLLELESLKERGKKTILDLIELRLNKIKKYNKDIDKNLIENKTTISTLTITKKAIRNVKSNFNYLSGIFLGCSAMLMSIRELLYSIDIYVQLFFLFTLVFFYSMEYIRCKNKVKFYERVLSTSKSEYSNVSSNVIKLKAMKSKEYLIIRILELMLLNLDATYFDKIRERIIQLLDE
ncbi:TPA: hypothetical protein RQJ37_001491 [Vibrio vulnificus]|nr:hypothetical protein [Vibrio vulnificus]HDY7898695.1 hypothetical protein [Vibrio vulnificus]HDY7938965.1 hypothetical protein [Vibrio vulnificus]